MSRRQDGRSNSVDVRPTPPAGLGVGKFGAMKRSRSTRRKAYHAKAEAPPQRRTPRVDSAEGCASSPAGAAGGGTTRDSGSKRFKRWTMLASRSLSGERNRSAPFFSWSFSFSFSFCARPGGALKGMSLQHVDLWPARSLFSGMFAQNLTLDPRVSTVFCVFLVASLADVELRRIGSGRDHRMISLAAKDGAAQV